MTNITLINSKQVRQRIESLLLSPARKRDVLSKLDKLIVKQNKARVRSQLNIDNSPYSPRRNKRRKKMLLKLGQRINEVSITESSSLISFKNKRDSNIASKHQFGSTQIMSAKQLKSADKNPKSTTDFATKRQAEALLEVGFKARKADGNFRTPSKTWIMTNMTIGQAGAILNDMRVTKELWEIILVPREVLGFSETDKHAIFGEFKRLILGVENA